MAESVGAEASLRIMAMNADESKKKRSSTFHGLKIPIVLAELLQNAIDFLPVFGRLSGEGTGWAGLATPVGSSAPCGAGRVSLRTSASTQIIETIHENATC
jgi:hypothetical protein